MMLHIRHGRAAALAAACIAAVMLAAFAPADAAAAARRATAKPAKKKVVEKAVARAVEAPPSTEQIAAQVYGLTDEDRYGEALEVVHDGLRDHPGDRDLRWLEANVTGWSGHHRESVKLFEGLLDDHPDLARDVRLDLARQRLWAGDPGGALRDLEMRVQEQPGDREAARLRPLALAWADRLPAALESYDALLASDPNDTDLAVGRADVLTWMGRHDQARQGYEDVLARDPGHRQARLGLANNVNWDGRHREAAAMYEQMLLESDPAPEAWKGLAWAYYWDGRSDRAHAPLERYAILRPDDPEGQELARMLAREQHPGLVVGYDWSEDSDDLRIFTTSIEYGLPASPRHTFAFQWRNDHVKDPGGSREPHRISVMHEGTWTDLWSSRATVSAFKPGPGATERGMGEVGVMWRPADRIRAEFDYAKEPVLTRRSLERDVDMRSGGASVAWQATSRMRLAADHHVFRYSDENRGSRTSGTFWFTVLQRRRAEVAFNAGVDILRTRFDLDNGYYDPERYVEYGPGLEATWRPRSGWDLGIESRIGWQEERNSETDPFHLIRLRADLPLGPYGLHSEFESSNSNLTSASGFEQSRWLLYIAAPW